MSDQRLVDSRRRRFDHRGPIVRKHVFTLGALEKVALIPEVGDNSGDELKSLSLTAGALTSVGVSWRRSVFHVIYNIIKTVKVKYRLL